MRALIFEHGSNAWNHLVEADIDAQLEAIAAGTAGALVAEAEGRIVGVVTFRRSSEFSRYAAGEHGHVRELVVHRDHRGRGLASRLLRGAAEELARQGLREVFVRRHEENAPSAAAMRKAGFREVETLDDPQRARRTTISRLSGPAR